jgi:hypothetical protein
MNDLHDVGFKTTDNFAAVKTEESAYVFQTIPNNIANEHL